MKRVFSLYTAILIFSVLESAGQGKGSVYGRIYNEKNNEPVPFANIIVWGTNIGSVSDMDGNFIFTGLEPGYIELRVSAVGYETKITSDILVTNARKTYIDIPLKESEYELEEVVVKASPFRRSEESPVSLRRIGIAEIEKNPGGNRDISKVIQSLPGVASTVSFRNDLIVRGGGASENRFYLDGVEIPTLNHFATQGASGGPVGIINVDFIREVNYYSGAFPANRGNALSSIFEFKQIEGNKDKLKFKGTVGASDLALTLDGPLSDNTTFIFSARRSYLQLLFSLLELPFLPTYNDLQFKVKSRLDENNELTLIGIGAYDVSELNLDANETPEQRYILGYLPENKQWNYATGAVWKHFRENGYNTFVVSRNYLNNKAYKYENNINSNPKILDYSSSEGETKFRYENNLTGNKGFKYLYGSGVNFARYKNSTYDERNFADTSYLLDTENELTMFNYNAFGQVSKSFLNKRLTLSAGVRFDGSSYSKEMRNPLPQFSPRFSVSYGITPDFFINFNTGRYFQRPAYTTMGYETPSGELKNKKNGLDYIRSDHIVAGFEYLPSEESKISIEGFFKNYDAYPWSVRDSVSISGKSADFGIYGDEEVLSVGKGRAYGMEVLARTRNFYGITAILAYTLVWSEFNRLDDNLDPTGRFVPNAWDNRHILNLTATRKFKNNWDFGLKWRYVGGAPYTPVDEYTSSIVQVWNASGQAVLDYSRYNQKRLDGFHQLDIRIDKGFYFNKWSLMIYLDIQNIYNFVGDSPPQFTRTAIIRDEPVENDPYTDPQTGVKRYKMEYLEGEDTGTILPSIGIIVEF